MARIRTLKPEFWQDEKMVRLPDTTRLVFLGLLSMADDFGRLVFNPKLIEAMLFDPDGPDRSRDVRDSLATLSRIRRVVVGSTASGQRIIQIANWSKHQKVDRPNTSAALPEIVAIEEDTSLRESLANHSREPREALATHTYDQYQRPTTNDRGPFPSPDGEGPTPAAVGLFDLDDDFGRQGEGGTVATATRSRTAVAKRVARATTTKPSKPSLFPHWSNDDRVALATVWSHGLAPVGPVEMPRFVKAFGRWFLAPESERSPDQPTDAEVADALAEILSARKHCHGGERLGVYEYASERIGVVVNVMRAYPDVIERMSVLEHRLNLRPTSHIARPRAPSADTRP